ncbi:MAG TPA: hypothetical protein VKW06_02010 [Candidatus Angelobacter sp.]|nr:hypothetical protein [Candidatus Angelobacter sp.]
MLALLKPKPATFGHDVIDLRLFREPERARRDWENVRERLPDHLLPTLLLLLKESPDPDQSLNLFERLVAEHAELAALFERNHFLLHYAIVMVGHSYWLGETLLGNRDLLHALNREKNLERSLDTDQYSQRLSGFRSSSGGDDISLQLARFKKREYVRIALRDLLGIATLGETTGEISALADVLIQAALCEAQRQLAERYQAASKTGFAVLALGKLGGSELNYSSDLDLLYLYDRGESSPYNDEYSVRLSQLLTTILSRPTTEGAVCRIDLRLRPQGQEGEPAVSLQHALEYYCRVARDWELQALIKARYVAGEASLARAFLRGIQSRVYTEHLNFAAIETALHSRQKIDSGKRRTLLSRGEDAPPDVKLDRGGIRDIEFLVQCLQRVYGGSEPWLRSGGTLFSLQKLYDKDHLQTGDFQRLGTAYEFLRRVEHRLQLQRGQQLHRLPQSAVELEVLRRSLPKPAGAGVNSILGQVHTCMAGVSEIYRRVIHNERDREGSAAKAAAMTTVYEPSLEQLLQRVDAPEFAALLRRSNPSRHARRALHQLLSALAGGEPHLSQSLSLLRDLPSAEMVLRLLETSDYLTDIVLRYPGSLPLLRNLENADGDWTPAHRLASTGDLGEIMASLRREFRTNMFLAGARDVLSSRSALDAMRQTTRAAEDVIHNALYAVGGNDHLAVFALGRLGTYEFDIASDADLLFVRDPGVDDDLARTTAEKLVHVLSAYTRDGTLFAVDARLRPHGGEGELVVTPAQIERYLAGEAQPWEALSYSKLRFIAGRQDIAGSVLDQVRGRIVSMASHPGFAQAVLEMRERLEKSNRYRHSFKLARGGFYDIDFIASFLMLRRALVEEGNTLERLAHLQRLGILDPPSHAALAEAAVLYRTIDHVIRLVTGRAIPEIPEAEHARASTQRLTAGILKKDSGEFLQNELDETAKSIREIFLQLVA